MNLNALRLLYREMKLSRRPRAEIERSQTQKLKQLLIHAKSNVPFYSELYRDIDINQVRELNDIELLPRITQEQIRATNPDLLLDKRMEKHDMLSFTTSGTSSKPSTHYITKKENELRQIKTLPSLIQLGWRPWWTMVSVRRSLKSKKYSLAQRLLNGKRIILNINLSPEQQLAEIRRHKPAILHGVTSCVEVIADYLIATNQQYKPKVLLTAGEVIPEKTKEKFLKAFGQQGYQRYGAVECGIMAFPAKNSPYMHVDEDSYFFEVLDDDNKPSQTGSGRLVITTLDQYSFPMIRYEIGDMVTYANDDVNTNNHYKKIKSIDGRIANTFVLKNGKVIPYQIVMEMYTKLDSVAKFQFLHDENQNVVFCYVKKEKVDDQAVRKTVLDILNIGPDIISFKSCDQIIAEKSGKFSWVKKVSAVKEFYHPPSG